MKDENGPRLELLLKAAKLISPDHTDMEVSLLQFEEQPINYEGFDLISTGDMYLYKLSAKRTEYLQPIVDQIDAYYPEDITDRFDILDPTRWAQQTLETFGNSDLQELNTALLWNYDEAPLKDGWRKLKSSVYSHKGFQQRKKGTPEDFWQYYLLDQSITWSADVKSIVKTVLTVQSSTARSQGAFHA